MTRLQVCGCASLALLMSFALAEFAMAEEPRNADPLIAPARSLKTGISDSAERSYKIYSLDDFGNDPGFCEWIAQTIPEVVAAGTWQGQGVIRYYPPKNILVVCHTSAVQKQVDGFLKDVRKSLSETTKARVAVPKGPTSAIEVVPTLYFDPRSNGPEPTLVHGYSAPAPVAAKPAPEPSLSYPVPAQAKPPKHLFHFIIRYEGEGIIDDNVVKMMKDYVRAQGKAIQAAPAAMYPTPPQAVSAPCAIPPSPASYCVPAGAVVPPPAVPTPNVVLPQPGTPPATPTPPNVGVAPAGTSPAVPMPSVNETETKKGEKGPVKEKQVSTR